MGLIERGGGDGGEPARSPLGWLEISPTARPRLRLRLIRGVSETGSLRHAHLAHCNTWRIRVDLPRNFSRD